jgi:uracil-DNA glycosylase family 4
MLDLNQKTNFESLTLEAFKDTVRSCEQCDLCQNRTNVVFGSGPIPCNLMIIGEGPGEQEDIQGEPFVGRAGKLLTSILESVGIQRDSDVFIANTVKCRPPNNRTPEQAEIEACKPYLIRQIQLVQPKILLLLGTPSLKTILEESLTITKVRGTWYKATVNYMDEPLYIMPLFHPSYLLRNSSKEKGKPKWLTWQDMKEVASALQFYKLSD